MSDLREWLEGVGLGKFADVLIENEIDFDILSELQDADLEKLGLPLGARKRLLRAIAALEEAGAPAPAPRPAPQEANLGERRHLTVMFCDLVGSTALSNELDPEDLSAVIRSFHDQCRGVVAEFGGTVARYMGDGMLVYFGFPKATEHDAEHAIRGGLAIVAAVSRIRHRGVRLQTRVGIASGLVVVGEVIGEGFAREQAVVGETPNLAARMQALAEPDSVVIAEETRRLTAGLFDCVTLGRRELKGFSEPMEAWRVRAERSIESRFVAQHAGRELAPLVGREEEVEILARRWRQASEGAGQVVVLSGEAGIGKSRLGESLRVQIGDEPHIAVRYYCTPNYQHSALFPFATQLERAARLAREDPPSVKLDKLEALLARSGRPVAPVAPLFAALIDIPTEGRYPALELSPPQRKALTLEAFEDQLAGLVRSQPVLVVFEDVHWADPTSLELLTRLVDAVSELRVLLLMTARPEFAPPWRGMPHVTVMTLNRLPRGRGAALVSAITGGKPLPRAVLDEIVARTDGVPLFVEELTRSLLESGLLVEEDGRYLLRGSLSGLSVPSTLQDSLMARLDHLGGAKETAQIGAALGRSFDHELLAAVAPSSEAELAASLQVLCDSDLLQRRGTPPAAVYTFKHALVQDTAYESLLRAKRQTLHARIARVLEERFADLVAMQPERLAQHFTGAGLGERAVEYWLRAGRRALEHSAFLEAASHCAQGIELVQGIAGSREKGELELDLRAVLGVALIATQGYAAEAVRTNYAMAQELCASLGETSRTVPTLYGLWVYHLLRGDRADALRLAEALHQFADQPGQPLVTHSALAISRFYQGDLARAAEMLEACTGLYEPAQHKALAAVYGDDAPLLAHFYLAWCMWLRGRPEAARRWQRESQALALRHGTPYILAVAALFEMILHHEMREVGAARASAARLKSLAEEHGYPFFFALGNVGHGLARVREGDGEGIDELEGGITGFRATGARLPVPYYLHCLVGACLQRGESARGLAAVEEALALSRAQLDRFYEAELLRQRGELLAARGETDAAEASLREALDLARRQGAVIFELRAAASLARLLSARGLAGDGKDLLASVRGRLTEGLASADLAEADALLASLGGS